MRILLLTVLALSTAACAGSRPPFHDGPPRLGRGDPNGPGGHGHEERALFISPMGEPFRVPHPEKAWFAGVDTDRDGRIVAAEFRADAARFFRVLDRNGDGEIDPDEVAFYENQLVPEVRVHDGDASVGGRQQGAGRRGRTSGGEPDRPGGSGGGGPGEGGFGGPGGGGPGSRRGGPRSGGTENSSPSRMEARGAARYGYLNLPEPITPADRNFNRGIDAGEFQQAADERFALLDRNGDGAITPGELPAVNTRVRGGFAPSPGGNAVGPGGFGAGEPRKDTDRDTNDQ